MKPFHGKLFHSAFLILCLLALATAGCQNDKGNKDDNNSESPAEVSQGASENDNANAIILVDHNAGEYNPVIDSVNFVSTIDNPYFTLTPGKVWIYEGKTEDGKTEKIEIEVTPDTKTILGVATTVVREREWMNGELVEDTFDWFAQDKE
jgi:hypothetical protein